MPGQLECKNGGTCNDDLMCDCTPSYVGTFCEAPSKLSIFLKGVSKNFKIQILVFVKRPFRNYGIGY